MLLNMKYLLSGLFVYMNFIQAMSYNGLHHIWNHICLVLETESQLRKVVKIYFIVQQIEYFSFISWMEDSVRNPDKQEYVLCDDMQGFF